MNSLFEEKTNIEIQIKVPAVPVAQPRQRHRTVKTNAGKSFVQNYTPAKHPVQSFKATVRMAFESAYSGPPLTGPLRCDLVFVMPRPQSMIWKTRAMPRVPNQKKPDIDNLSKAVFDALNGAAFVDDSMIYYVSVQKYIASGDEAPHVIISLKTYDELSQKSASEVLSEQTASPHG